MNIKVKQLTLIATAGFLLAACGQGKKEETRLRQRLKKRQLLQQLFIA